MNKTKVLKSALYQGVCLLIGLVIIAPVVYCVLVSFMQPSEVLTKQLHLLPDGLYLGNYLTVLTKTKIFRYMLNSLVVAFVSSLVQVLLCSLCAYGFAFFRFKGCRWLFFAVVGCMIIPGDVLIFQNYFTVSDLHLINTYLGMMIVYFVSAANIFIMRQNFVTYSLSVRDAAYVDGCGDFKFYWRILMPSSVPILITVFISSFVGAWNAYLWPLLVTNKDEMRTAQTAVAMLNAADSNPYGTVMAASTLILLPSILVFILFQRRVVAGMMTGAVKE